MELRDFFSIDGTTRNGITIIPEAIICIIVSSPEADNDPLSTTDDKAEAPKTKPIIG